MNQEELGNTVTCVSCGAANREGSRFCGECGKSLVRNLPCPSCGSENPEGQRFCNACGARLGDQSEAPRAAGPPEASGQSAPEVPQHLLRKARAQAGELTGERKQVTVLFADVMGSMDLSERMDPERWQ